MKRIILSATAVALALTGSNAFALTTSASGSQPPVCSVDSVPSSLTIPTDGGAVSGPVKITCNDYKGASLTVASANGELKHSVSGVPGVDYLAVWSHAPHGSSTLNTSGAALSNTSSPVGSGGALSAAGQHTGSISVDPHGPLVNAGTYSDTLTMTIAVAP